MDTVDHPPANWAPTVHMTTFREFAHEISARGNFPLANALRVHLGIKDVGALVSRAELEAGLKAMLEEA
jgi:hypothetical protein